MRAHEFINEDWQKTNKHDKTDGMSQKAVNVYRKENPGSKLKTAVTTKPSKLKKGSKSAKRRKSFCARMSGMKKHRAGAKTKRDPDSPINKALRRWNCESVEEMQELIMLGETYIASVKEERVDEFVQALAPIAMGVGRAAATGAQMVGRGAMAAGRMAVSAAQKGAQAVGNVAGQVGKAAGQVGKAASQGAQKVGQVAQQVNQTNNKLQLGKDIANQLAGKADDDKQQQQAQSGIAPAGQNQMMGQQPNNPNSTIGQIGQGQQPVQDEEQGQQSPEMIGRNNALAKLDPTTSQSLQAAAPKTGSTINNTKIGPMKVLPQEPGVPDAQKGIRVQPTQVPGMPPVTLKYKDLAQLPGIKKDLGAT
jgi:hypothetical protein